MIIIIPFYYLRKVVYRYGWFRKIQWNIVTWERRFYSHLNTEDITDADYAHAKRVCKNLGEYHDLFAQSNKLLLADVFENFENMYLEIYELGPAKFLSAPGLAWQAALKTTRVKLDLLTDIDVLLMVEKRITGGICHSIYRYAKANNKYMEDCNEIKNRHIFNVGM